MDLFEKMSSSENAPLAEKVRPLNIEDLVGQDEITKGNFRKLIEKDQIPSLILWGPSGTGKTTLAQLLASKTKKHFISVNAIEVGAKALSEIGTKARQRHTMYGEGSFLFIDEIHRLNKAQQDVLLSFVEKGDVTLIGATTENPSFEINTALMSRCRLITFRSLEEKSLSLIVDRVLKMEKLERQDVFEKEAYEWMLKSVSGDARQLINNMEQILKLRDAESWPLNKKKLVKVIGQIPLHYSKSGDAHYDTISAFIKSIRGSDPDAGLYYLARMIEAGEDPKFIARRLVILASEDIGNADPRALTLAMAGAEAVQFIGLPEAAINLAQVVTYLACAPKSNRSYIGLKTAIKEVKRSGALKIPLHVRNAPTKMMKDLGYGKDYKYAHDSEKGWFPQTFLPDGVEGSFYEPSDHGFEKTMKAYLQWLKSV